MFYITLKRNSYLKNRFDKIATFVKSSRSFIKLILRKYCEQIFRFLNTNSFRMLLLKFDLQLSKSWKVSIKKVLKALTKISGSLTKLFEENKILLTHLRASERSQNFSRSFDENFLWGFGYMKRFISFKRVPKMSHIFTPIFNRIPSLLKFRGNQKILPFF